MKIIEKLTKEQEKAMPAYIRTLGNKIYCEIHGDEDYFIEKLHPDLKGKMYADLVAKCGLVICTFSKVLDVKKK